MLIYILIDINTIFIYITLTHMLSLFLNLIYAPHIIKYPLHLQNINIE